MRNGLLLVWTLTWILACERVPNGPMRQEPTPPRRPTATPSIREESPSTPLAAPIVNKGNDDDPATKGATEIDGCGSELERSIPHDLYRALTHGSDEDKAVSALFILKDRANHARAVVQRAIVEVGIHPYCAQLRPLMQTLQDDEMDETTRGSAALAFGAIAQNFPCTFPTGACPKPHDPIPSWAQRALHDCATRQPVMVARACVEALGYVSSTDRQFLVKLRDDQAQDPVLRVFAGRALTRLTHEPQVTPQSLDDLMGVAHAVAAQ